MRKGFRYVLIGFIVISFGVIIMLVGLAHGGQNKLGWHNGRFEVSQIKSIHHKIKPAQKLDVETANVPVILETGKQKKIEIKGRITNPDFLHITRAGKQLKIRYVPNQEKGYEVSFSKREPEKIVISLPQKMRLDDYQQSAVYGAMNIANIAAKHVTLTATNANVQMNNVNTANLSTSAHDAEIALHNIKSQQTTINVNDSRLKTDNVQMGRLMLSADESVTNLQHTAMNTSAIQVTSGTLKLLDTKIQNQNIMTIMDGSLKASGLPNVGLQMQTTAGRVKVAGENYGNSYANDLGNNNQLNVSVSNGNITIK
jgi:hypothetical protein